MKTRKYTKTKAWYKRYGKAMSRKSVRPKKKMEVKPKKRRNVISPEGKKAMKRNGVRRSLLNKYRKYGILGKFLVYCKMSLNG